METTTTNPEIIQNIRTKWSRGTPKLYPPHNLKNVAFIFVGQSINGRTRSDINNQFLLSNGLTIPNGDIKKSIFRTQESLNYHIYNFFLNKSKFCNILLENTNDIEDILTKDNTLEFILYSFCYYQNSKGELVPGQNFFIEKDLITFNYCNMRQIKLPFKNVYFVYDYDTTDIKEQYLSFKRLDIIVQNK